MEIDVRLAIFAVSLCFGAVSALFWRMIGAMDRRIDRLEEQYQGADRRQDETLERMLEEMRGLRADIAADRLTNEKRFQTKSECQRLTCRLGGLGERGGASGPRGPREED